MQVGKLFVPETRLRSYLIASYCMKTAFHAIVIDFGMNSEQEINLLQHNL